MEELNTGDVVYFTRILPNIAIFELFELKVCTVNKSGGWFIGYDTKTHVAFWFYDSEYNFIVFKDRKTAINKINESIIKMKENV